MKELIRDILREQTDDMSGRDDLVGGGTWAKMGKLKEKLRLLFTYMTTVGGSDGCAELLEYYENNGPPSQYGFNNSPGNQKEMAVLYGRIEQGFKVIGLNPTSRSPFLIYTILVNYIHNGGSQRKFSEGDIELVPGKMVDVDVSMKETVTEYFTLMCEAYGGNKDKAVRVVKENPWLYEVDRQTEDHDYHGDMELDEGQNVEVTDRQMNLQPSTFGL